LLPPIFLGRGLSCWLFCLSSVIGVPQSSVFECQLLPLQGLRNQAITFSRQVFGIGRAKSRGSLNLRSRVLSFGTHTLALGDGRLCPNPPWVEGLPLGRDLGKGLFGTTMQCMS